MTNPTREEYEARRILLGYDFYDEQTNSFWKEIRDGSMPERTYEEVDADTLAPLSTSEVFERLGVSIWGTDGKIRMADTFNAEETDPG